MTWFANVLVLVGLVLAGRKNKWAFAFTFVGEVIWAVVGAQQGMWDLASICGVFAIVAAVNFWQWWGDEDADDKRL